MRLLGLDWGERRIGVAATDPTGTIAYPLEVVERGVSSVEGDSTARSQRPTLHAPRPTIPPGWLMRIGEICRELGVEKIVVGLPRGLRGQTGSSVQQAEDLARQIGQELQVEVVLWDERLTTAEAEKRMIEADERRDRRRRYADSVAAALMLESYLNSQT